MADNREGEWALEITRLIAAPRSLVWRALTDPAMVRAWGPEGRNCDPQPGHFAVGEAWRTRLVSCEGGPDLWQGGRYLAIEPETLLRYTFAWDAADPATEAETIVTITLADDGGGTRLTLHQQTFRSRAARDGHARGWTEAMGALAALAEGRARA